MAARIQSPSSINTYKQCPRKYYYQYIVKLPRIESIHQIRGKIVHTTLETFFKIDISQISKEHQEFELNALLQGIFQKEWETSRPKLLNLRLDSKSLEFYYQESKEMLESWYQSFLSRVKLKQNNSLTFEEAFNLLKPKTEVHFVSEEFQVQGFIDAIHDVNGEVSLMDYKTSKNGEISDEYKLQLAIYALLFYEKYGKHPTLVGIDFLKHGPKYLRVDEELYALAETECKLIQENTTSEDIRDYPMNPGPLCKWSTGQCDFYDICFGQKKLDDFTDQNL
jgi:ATP-dependent helicase/DNAse subunit B